MCEIQEYPNRRPPPRSGEIHSLAAQPFIFLFGFHQPQNGGMFGHRIITQPHLPTLLEYFPVSKPFRCA